MIKVTRRVFFVPGSFAQTIIVFFVERIPDLQPANVMTCIHLMSFQATWPRVALRCVQFIFVHTPSLLLSWGPDHRHHKHTQMKSSLMFLATCWWGSSAKSHKDQYIVTHLTSTAWTLFLQQNNLPGGSLVFLVVFFPLWCLMFMTFLC